MFDVCSQCGEHSEDKAISADGRYAKCGNCGHQHKFLRLPLFVITGASGTGKSTAALELITDQTQVVCLDSDILWRDEFANSDNDFREYRNLWLRMAKNISQNGRPVALFGTATPGQFEQCVQRRYFDDIYYLALVCDRNTLINRLKARPGWRKSGTESVLDSMTNFNQWLIDNAPTSSPPIALLDTSAITLDETVSAVKNWMSVCLRAKSN